MSAASKPDPESCGLAIIGLVTVPVAYMMDGWVLWLAWRWWLVEMGAPTLPFGTAVAIVFVVGLLTASIGLDRDMKRTLTEQWTLIVVAPLTLWVLGLVAS